MSTGLHLLGVDSKKTTSAVFKALAEGLATGATGQRSYGANPYSSTGTYSDPAAQARYLEQQRLQAEEESTSVWWYVAGGAAVAIALAVLLGRSR